MNDLQINVAALTDVGRVRNVNEDACSITDLDTGRRFEPAAASSSIDVGPRGLLLLLSDGMGGHAAGEVASTMLLDSLREALGGLTDRDSIVPGLTAAVRAANAEILDAAKEEGRRGMGATLTALLFRPHEATIAEVGDSRAYLLREGTLHQLTRDQSLVQFLVDHGALTPEAAKTSKRKNVLLQAVGIGEEVQTAIGRLKLRRKDRFLLCCDGLSNAIPDDELKSLLEGADPAEVCRRMVELANERGGADNLTAIVAHVDGKGLEEPSPTETLSGTFEVLQSFTGAT